MMPNTNRPSTTRAVTVEITGRDLREQAVHRGIVAVAFEDNGERAGGACGCFFEEIEDGIGNVMKMIVEKALRAIGSGDKFAAGNVDGGDAAGRNLADKFEGVVAVIEAVGKPETWASAVQLVCKGGVVNFFGGCPSGSTVSLDTQLIHYSNLTLLASFHHTPRTIRRALEFVEAGVIRAADFVDGECPLTQLPELFKSMVAGNSAIKTLVRVHE